MMGRSLHDMMLRNIGITYDIDTLDVIDIETVPHVDGSGKERFVHTIRFLQTGFGRDGEADDSQLIVPRERTRSRG